MAFELTKASEEQLLTLHGIGKVRAKKILDWQSSENVGSMQALVNASCQSQHYWAEKIDEGVITISGIDIDDLSLVKDSTQKSLDDLVEEMRRMNDALLKRYDEQSDSVKESMRSVNDSMATAAESNAQVVNRLNNSVST